jgi:hypothetical protein
MTVITLHYTVLIIESVIISQKNKQIYTVLLLEKQESLLYTMIYVMGIHLIKEENEAKISDWRGVIDQANMNRWFASESCVLSPVSKPSEQVINNAKANGIGIYAMPFGMQAKTVQKPERLSGLPVSYASWLFNEWIGRQIFKERGLV